MGGKEPEVYAGLAHVTDGTYHAIKITRRGSMLELYVDGIRIKLEGGSRMGTKNLIFRKIKLK